VDTDSGSLFNFLSIAEYRISGDLFAVLLHTEVTKTLKGSGALSVDRAMQSQRVL